VVLLLVVAVLAEVWSIALWSIMNETCCRGEDDGAFLRSASSSASASAAKL
jgi:hypothetical protein